MTVDELMALADALSHRDRMREIPTGSMWRLHATAQKGGA